MRGLIVLLTVPLVLLVGSAQAAARTDGSVPAPAQISQLVTSVPVSALNQVGAGEISGPNAVNPFNVFKLHSGALSSNGKPELLSQTFAWCPHCASNSWATAVALTRFGVLSGLRVIDSGTYYCKLTSDPCSLKPSPCYSHTKGLSFLDAKLKSPYLSFDDVVLQGVHGHNLEAPTRKQIAAFKTFDPEAEAPALDVGGDYAFLNSGFDPGALAHKSWLQIASSLAHPRDQIAKHIDGLANLFTAAICKVTKGRPHAVCKSRGVVAAADGLKHATPPPRPPPPQG